MATKGKLKIVVVVHIHYIDTARVIADALSRSALKDSDLYITLTPDASKARDKIEKIFPRAIISSYENMGRDIRPFLLLMNEHRLGHRYDLILKLHGKKTIALPGYGAFWLVDSLNKLLPKSQEQLNNLSATISKKSVIGPAGQLFRYDQDTDKNDKYLRGILKSLNLDGERQEQLYFFGGSMLWFDAKEAGVFANAVDLDLFPEEKGQYDGTLAHAVERAFTISFGKRHKSVPTVVDFSHGTIRDMSEIDISIDGLIREYEEFSAKAVLVGMGGREYIMDYRDLKHLQEESAKRKMNPETAIRSVEQPDNVHTLLIKTQEELARIKSSKKYRALERTASLMQVVRFWRRKTN